MKKYHLYLWIIALVGLMTSCSQDETDALPTDTNANRVTLTASLPADFVQPQLKSRALPAAPTDHKLRCILEVWDTEDTPALKIRQEICPSAGDAEIDFSFDLATAGTYKALLWADYIPANQEKSSQEIAGLAGVDSYGNKYYTTTNGLKKVEISITLPIYPEEGDAFFASAEFTKAEKALTIPTVTLTRPFMKLTIAEKNAERFASCEHVIAHFNTLYKFDVATGNATGIKNYGLPAANGHRNYGNDITIGGQTCETLICLYLFANAEDGTMGDIKLEFASSDPDKSLPTVTIPAGIPLKRNYCVNAAGNLIGEPSSSTVNMTVDINSDWTGTENETISAKVGDYYYKDGTWSSTYTNNSSNPCIGIVFEVNADEKSGKIVSLDERNLAWSTFDQETGINHPSDGAVNTLAVQNWIGSVANADGSKALTDFPAFNWCIKKNDGNRTWYLPAMAELKILAANVVNVNTALTALSETTLDTNQGTGCYWSSYEGNSDVQYYAMALMLDGVKEEKTSKKTVCKVRAISVF